jgi:uracil-DNA glycosylase
MSAENSKHKFPLVHFENPFLPPVGQDIANWADKLGKAREYVIRRCLYGGGGYQMEFSINAAGDKKLMQVVSGHKWYANEHRQTGGPSKADVMLVGKCLNDNDLAAHRIYAGDMGTVLRQGLRSAGWSDDEIIETYITTVLKTVPLDWGKTTLPQLWVQSQIHLFWQELLLVQPKFVLLQGAEVVKAVLGKKFTLKQVEADGAVMEIDFAATTETGPDIRPVRFIASVSPAAVLHDRRNPKSDQKFRTHVEQRFHRQLRDFHAEVSGTAKSTQKQITVEVVDNLADLEQALVKMRRECQDKLVAWDAEWQGAHPQNDGAYLRCIQFAYRDDHGVVIALRHPGGEKRFTHKVIVDGEAVDTTVGAEQAAMRMCKRYMKGLRVVGHYFVADLEWLVPAGLDLRDEYDAAPTPNSIHAKQGGVATELMAHAWDETALFSLDDQIQTHLDIPLYSGELDKYKKQAKERVGDILLLPGKAKAAATSELRAAKRAVSRARKPADVSAAVVRLRTAEERFSAETRQYRQVVADHAKRVKELSEGYGWIPDEVLYPYGAWDVVAELLLGRFYLKNIRSDRHGKDATQAYWISHRAALPVWEMNSTGLVVDRKRVDYFAEVFSAKRDSLLAELRRELRWPTFNPRSRFEFAEALFGEQYNGYFQQYGKKRRTRPKGALTLRAVPLRTTGRYPMEWEEAMTKLNGVCTPSTGKQTLGEMFYAGDKLRVYRRAQDGWRIKTYDGTKLLGLMRDFRFLDQALKSLIRSPVRDSENNVIKDDEGWNDYDSGIIHMVCGDGRVRTRIRQTVETGRWASYDPNLTNLSKSREKDYKRILGGAFTTSIRTVFTAQPGWFLVEADYSGAELMMAAIMAGDANMIEHCRRNTLKDDDPAFYDIHSALTVKAFRLDCEPTKAGLESLEKAHLRTVAKSVLFGLMYGRSARAIAIAVRQEGVYVTEQEAQDIINAIFAEYPSLKTFLDDCVARAAVGWLRNMFGRYRRFPFTNEESKLKAFGREAMNAPMQGGVADAVSIAARNVYDYRNEHGMQFKLALQMHDALMLEVPANELLHVIDREVGVLQQCMVDMLPLRRTDLLGRPAGDPVIHRFGIGIDVYGSWGEDPYPDRFLDYGLSPEIAGWKQSDEDPAAWLKPVGKGKFETWKRP